MATDRLAWAPGLVQSCAAQWRMIIVEQDMVLEFEAQGEHSNAFEAWMFELVADRIAAASIGCHVRKVDIFLEAHRGSSKKRWSQ